MTAGTASGHLLRRTDLAWDGTVLAFAVWTLCCHLAVFSGWSLDELTTLAGVVFATAAIALGVAARRRRAARAEPRPRTPAATVEASSSAPAAATRLVVLAIAAGCAAGAAAGAPLSAVWSVAGLLAIGLCWRELRTASERPEPARVGAGALVLLAVLALGCVVATLCAHRPDADDGFYLNLAVAAADAPHAALLAGDTLHRVPGVPLALPVYRVHSLELLEAVLSRASGRPVLDVAHLALPALAALMLPFAYARLLRQLTPRAWPWALAGAAGFLLFSATASHGWANFGLVRLHQGKALLLSLALPLAVAYALEFARDGGVLRFVRLAAVQIGAVGLSASGLWLAPAVAGPALLAGLQARDKAGLVRLAEGCAASAYVLVLGLLLQGATAATFRDAAVPSPELRLGNLRLAEQAMRAALGPGLPGFFALFVAFGAWSFAENALARRVCAFSLFATLVLWNPLAAKWIAAWLTSAPTYWRVMWLLPLPALFGLVLAAPLESPAGTLSRSARMAAVAATTVILFGVDFAVDPAVAVLSAGNHVRLGAPGWKIPPAELAAVRSILAVSREDDVVLAPRRVAPWIPAFQHHPTPLVVRIEYLPVLSAKLGPEELARRVRLLRLVSGGRRPPQADTLLREAIRQDGLSIVCLGAAARRWPDVADVLRDTGFQKIHADADYEVWKRPREAAVPRTPSGVGGRPGAGATPRDPTDDAPSRPAGREPGKAL